MTYLYGITKYHMLHDAKYAKDAKCHMIHMLQEYMTDISSFK